MAEEIVLGGGPLENDYVMRVQHDEWNQCPYKRGSRELLCTPYSTRTQWKETIYDPENGLTTQYIYDIDPMIWNLQSPELWTVRVFTSLSVCYFIKAA